MIRGNIITHYYDEDGQPVPVLVFPGPNGNNLVYPQYIQSLRNYPMGVLMANNTTVSGDGHQQQSAEASKAVPERESLLPASFSPGPWDVICSRGLASFHNEGNIRLRGMIDECLEEYLQANKNERVKIVSNIIDNILEKSKVGFVRQDHDSKRWYKTKRRIAREKVGQGIRAALKKKGMYKSKPAGAKAPENTAAPDDTARAASLKDAASSPASTSSTDEPLVDPLPEGALPEPNRHSDLEAASASTASLKKPAVDLSIATLGARQITNPLMHPLNTGVPQSSQLGMPGSHASALLTNKKIPSPSLHQSHQDVTLAHRDGGLAGLNDPSSSSLPAHPYHLDNMSPHGIGGLSVPPPMGTHQVSQQLTRVDNLDDATFAGAATHGLQRQRSGFSVPEPGNPLVRQYSDTNPFHFAASATDQSQSNILRQYHPVDYANRALQQMDNNFGHTEQPYLVRVDRPFGLSTDTMHSQGFDSQQQLRDQFIHQRQQMLLQEQLGGTQPSFVGRDVPLPQHHHQQYPQDHQDVPPNSAGDRVRDIRRELVEPIPLATTTHTPLHPPFSEQQDDSENNNSDGTYF